MTWKCENWKWPLVCLGPNISASTQPKYKIKDSFEILRTSRFQNWPYFLDLVKIWWRYCQKTNCIVFLWTRCITRVQKKISMFSNHSAHAPVLFQNVFDELWWSWKLLEMLLGLAVKVERKENKIKYFWNYSIYPFISRSCFPRFSTWNVAQNWRTMTVLNSAWPEDSETPLKCWIWRRFGRDIKG